MKATSTLKTFPTSLVSLFNKQAYRPRDIFMPKVIVFGVKQRGLVAHEDDFGKGRLDHFRASIRGTVVDADHFELDVPGIAVNGS